MPSFFPPLFKTLLGASERQLIDRIQFLKAENEILRNRLPKHIKVTPGERARLLRLGKPLGSAIRDLISTVTPRTFLRWVNGEGKRTRPPIEKAGRPPVAESIQQLVLRIANETGMGYTKIRGELNKLGIHLARNTIRSILKRHGITPDPHRGEGRWDQFIRAHAQTLWACDFFSVKAWTARGLAEFHLLLFIHIGSRRIFVTPCTKHPAWGWVAQQARNFCMQVRDSEMSAKYLIRDRDSKFHRSFDAIMEAEGITTIKLPIRSPDLNAIAERAIQSVKNECLDLFVILGEKHLDYLVNEYVEFYNRCRPHSAVGHLPPCRDGPPSKSGEILCEERLGGLLKHYYREAA